jgi:flagellin-specific chaperone FliS
MMRFSGGAASAYRKVELDARIEASAGEDLTRICLEEAVASLGQAVAAMEHRPGQVPHEPLSRAHGIAIWLARSVAPDNPLNGPLTQFYGGVATTIANNMTRTSLLDLVRTRDDLSDVLNAARAA